MFGTILIALLAFSAHAESYPLLVDGVLEGWEKQGFEAVAKATSYAVVQDESFAGRTVLIEADSSGSGYIRVGELPFKHDAMLNIAWRVDSVADAEADERTKSGDDFPLRIYFADSTSMGADTLVLVHARQSPAGSSWTSPYSNWLAEFKLHAIGGTDTQLGQWQRRSIPLGKLWTDLYGSVPDKIKLIGFMGDTDNAGGKSTAMLGLLELVVN